VLLSHAALQNKHGGHLLLCTRARKLPLEISTSWWKGLGQFRPAAHQGASGGGEVPFGARWSKHPPFRAQNFDQLVEDPFKNSKISGLRLSHFDPSTSLRALLCIWRLLLLLLSCYCCWLPAAVLLLPYLLQGLSNSRHHQQHRVEQQAEA
jgi:hypothetical protein